MVASACLTVKTIMELQNHHCRIYGLVFSLMCKTKQKDDKKLSMFSINLMVVGTIIACSDGLTRKTADQRAAKFVYLECIQSRSVDTL